MIWAVVAFADSRRPILRWLKPGWRHVCVLVETPVGWVGLEPLFQWSPMGWIDWAFDLSCKELADEFVARGWTAAVACCLPAPEPDPRRMLIGAYTCVEAVKRALGIASPWIVTPRQLHRWLCSRYAVYEAAK